jgi:tetratricopeptide (TPR) repeat protein
LDNEGVARLEAGELDKAISAFDRAISKNPQLAVAYLHRATAFVTAGSLERAAADYEKALELDPALNGMASTNLLRIYNQLAYAALEAKDFTSAVANFDKLLALDPDDAATFRARGDAFFALGSMTEADLDYKKAVELNPALAEQLTIRRAITAGTFDLPTEGPGASFSFVDSSGVLYIIQPGKAEVEIAKGANRGGSWSPDGSKLAFGCDVRVCLSALDGRPPTGWPCNAAWTPAWAPAGDRFAAICYDSDARVVYLGVFTLGTGDIQRVVSFAIDDPAVAYFMHDRSAWSADGNSILYVRCIRTAQFCNLYAANVSSGQERMVLANAEQGAWSPDGRSTVATRVVSFTRIILVAAADGSGATRLADGWAPVWSPDSGRLAFQRADGLHIVDVGTRAEVTVVAPSVFNCHGCPPLAWSPDGSRLAAQATLSGSDNVGRGQIRVYDTTNGVQVGISFPGTYAAWGAAP